MKKSQRPKNDDRIPFMSCPPKRGQCYEALKPLDKVAAELEAKWGVEHLQSLVSPDLAMRFERARQQLDDAIETDDPELTAQKAAALIRGWRALDKAATDAGHTTEPDRVWYCEQDGFAIAIVQHHAEAQHIAEGHRVFTVDEITRLIGARYSEVYHAKTLFPSAEVTDAKNVKEIDLDGGGDAEIPF